MSDRHALTRRIRKLLDLAGGDPTTDDPEKIAAHAKAEQIDGGHPKAWRDHDAVRRVLEAIHDP